MAVSALHEDLLNLVRERPAFAVELAELANVHVPTFGSASVVDSTLKVELAAKIATVAVAAVSRFLDPNDPKKRAAYLRLIERYLSEPARKIFQMTTEAKRIYADVYYDGEEKGLAKGLAKGRAEGEASSILRILAVRKVAVSEEIRQRILACTDEALLERWLEQSIAVTTVDELFA